MPTNELTQIQSPSLIRRIASSELMKQTLGEHIHSYLVETKRAEWMDYLRHVSAWELERYLGVL